MRRAIVILLEVPVLLLLFSAGIAAQQKDDPKCKDHPLLTRMPGYWIHGCEVREFNTHAFPVGKGKAEQVEGAFWRIRYYPQASATTKPSELQILRNFEAAIVKLGGKAVYVDKARETLYLAKDGREFWIDLAAEFTGKYFLTIVEKAGMRQDVVADAGVFSNELKATGHTAVYGIYFDTGKAEIKPESDVAMAEIAKLLKTDAGLQVNVVGHTDAVGAIDANMGLSQARANAVVTTLVGKHGIAAGRLKAYGVGPLAPVASNDTEEGRARNRRVELVKR